MPVTAVRTALSPAHARPSGPKVCVQTAHWYAFLPPDLDRHPYALPCAPARPACCPQPCHPPGKTAALTSRSISGLVEAADQGEGQPGAAAPGEQPPRGDLAPLRPPTVEDHEQHGRVGGDVHVHR